jgi:hypothetical protein
MPLSSAPVNKLFAVNAIFPAVTEHCGLLKTTKSVFTQFSSRAFNIQFIWFSFFIEAAGPGAVVLP